MSEALDQVDDDGDAGFDQAVKQFEADSKPATPEPELEVKAEPEAETPEPEDTESEAETAPEDAEPEAAPDIWAGLSEQQQAELERIQQRDRSNAGRVSSTQREINRLQRQLAERAHATPAAPATPATEAAPAAETPATTPAPAKPATETPEARAEREAVEFRLQMYEARPDWVDVASSDAFKAWTKEQPAYIQAQTTQDNAAAALTVLSLWDASQKNTARTDKARKLTEQREQRLAESRETNGGKSTPPAGGDSDDDGDAGFALAVKQFEKEQQAGRRF